WRCGWFRGRWIAPERRWGLCRCGTHGCHCRFDETRFDETPTLLRAQFGQALRRDRYIPHAVRLHLFESLYYGVEQLFVCLAHPAHANFACRQRTNYFSLMPDELLCDSVCRAAEGPSFSSLASVQSPDSGLTPDALLPTVSNSLSVGIPEPLTHWKLQRLTERFVCECNGRKSGPLQKTRAGGSRRGKGERDV